MFAKRVGAVSLGLAAVAGAGLTLLDRPAEALALTVTAAVAIINGLWLEGALARVVQPGRPRYSRGAVARLIARWALWTILFAGLYVLRHRFGLWAVAAGIGCHVIGVVVVGARADAGRAEG